MLMLRVRVRANSRMESYQWTIDKYTYTQIFEKIVDNNGILNEQNDKTKILKIVDDGVLLVLLLPSMQPCLVNECLSIVVFIYK